MTNRTIRGVNGRVIQWQWKPRNVLVTTYNAPSNIWNSWGSNIIITFFYDTQRNDYTSLLYTHSGICVWGTLLHRQLPIQDQLNKTSFKHNGKCGYLPARFSILSTAGCGRGKASLMLGTKHTQDLESDHYTLFQYIQLGRRACLEKKDIEIPCTFKEFVFVCCESSLYSFLASFLIVVSFSQYTHGEKFFYIHALFFLDREPSAPQA